VGLISGYGFLKKQSIYDSQNSETCQKLRPSCKNVPVFSETRETKLFENGKIAKQ
jgi:hypothetical protein